MRQTTIGTKIRKLRIERQWSQTELAFEAGIHQEMVCRHELDRNLPDTRTLQKYAKAFNIPISLLLG